MDVGLLCTKLGKIWHGYFMLANLIKLIIQVCIGTLIFISFVFQVDC